MNQRRLIVENAAYMYLVQAANYLLPLITFPYQVRILGIENYGLLSFVASFIQYLVVFTDYGFNLTATREVSIHRKDEKRISEICSVVYSIKTAFFLISCLFMLLLVLTIEKFNRHLVIHLVSLLAVLGNLLYPAWFYQGMERLKTIALINLFTRLIATVSIFLFVKGPEDIVIAAVIQNGGPTLSGLVGFSGIFFIHKIHFEMPSWTMVRRYLKEGWYIFASIVSSTLVNNTNIFLLGIFANNIAVGYYAVAEKIVRIFINMIVPISSSIYPHVGKLFSESRTKALEFLKKVLLLCGLMFLFISIGIFIFADFLVVIISGQSNPQITTLLRIMSILPFTIFVDNIYGTQILINIGEAKRFLLSLFVPGAISLIASLILVPRYQARATATIFLTSELLILFLMYYQTRLKGIRLWSNCQAIWIDMKNNISSLYRGLRNR